MKVKAGLVIDFGNSGTRMYLIVANNSKLTMLSNRFAALPPQYSIPKEYRNSKTNIICVKGSYYAHGSLAEREFIDELIRPSSVEHKTDQLVTELSLNLAVVQALTQLAEARGVAISEVEATFDVSALLPPQEHDIKAEKLTALIKGLKSVSALMPVEMNNSFEIGKVEVLPEGVAAFFGVNYDEIDGSLVEVASNQKFSTGYVLVLDIGAGTTDVVLIKDTELVLNSKDSFNKGGNTVESNLRNEIRRKFGFAPKDLSNVVATGLLEEGPITHDVADLVTAAKEGYTKILIPDLMDYLERMSISLKEVKGVLVVGGGSLPSEREDENKAKKIVSPAMSEVLLTYLKKIAPNISIMDISNKNPRLLNIEGLKYIHKYS